MRTIRWFSYINSKEKRRDMGIALFHIWGVEYEEFENGAGNCTVAIIELPSGKVETVLPSMIMFVEESEDKIN
jgi:hypothetical protein